MHRAHAVAGIALMHAILHRVGPLTMLVTRMWWAKQSDSCNLLCAKVTTTCRELARLIFRDIQLFETASHARVEPLRMRWPLHSPFHTLLLSQKIKTWPCSHPISQPSTSNCWLCSLMKVECHVAEDLDHVSPAWQGIKRDPPLSRSKGALGCFCSKAHTRKFP